MFSFTNSEISEILELTAKLLELHNENPFKIRALQNAAYKVSKHEISLIQMPPDELEKLEGIGKGIALKIAELKSSGTTQELNELKKKTPEGILELFKVKGLGPKKIAKLWNELGIESLGELMYACKENRLIDIKGFGPKTQQSIIESVQFILSNKEWALFADAEIVANKLVDEIKYKHNVRKIKLTGQIERKCETVNCITMVFETDNKFEVPEFYGGLKVETYFANQSAFENICFVTSCTPQHLNHLIEINPNLKTDLITENVYKDLGIQFIPPELREGLNEVSLAKSFSLPKLIEAADIKGLIHNHTSYSDGQHTLSEMAIYAKELGYEYLVINDHSVSAYYAGGLTNEKIFQQHREIDELNAQLAPFRIFKGIESDIRVNGDLDYEEDILKSFDVVVASIHQGFNMSEEQATFRIIKAIENPYTTILGHPTGRLLLSRKGYTINYKKIIDACAANKVSIELNANPYRLDIDWRWIPYCIEKGVLISINADAHSKLGYHDIVYGINVARKGMLTPTACLNTKSLNDFEKYLKLR